MILNTYDRTPTSENNKSIPVSFIICAIVLYGIVGFAVFVSNHCVIRITVILVTVLMTAVVLLAKRDTERSCIGITGNEIIVTDYVLGIKKEKRISRSDITSAEICHAYSPKIKGYRFSPAGEHFIVFFCGKKYLFKIIHLPETEEIFKQYIQKAR